jgi:hypothetical protein
MNPFHEATLSEILETSVLDDDHASEAKPGEITLFPDSIIVAATPAQNTHYRYKVYVCLFCREEDDYEYWENLFN